MLNRTAEALLWIGRYTERAENHARMIDVFYHLRESEAGEEQHVWKRLVAAVGDPQAYEEKYGEYTEVHALTHLILDKDRSNSLISCVTQARTNLRNVREKIPSELWEIMNGCYLWLKDCTAEHVFQQSPHLFLRRVKEALATYQGACQSILYRDQLWHWSESGRYLERCENTLRLLFTICDSWSNNKGMEFQRLQAVLQAVGGSEGFRRQYHDRMDAEAVATFLITNSCFPRSVQFAIHMLEDQIEAIQHSDPRSSDIRLTKPVKLACKMRSELELLEYGDLHPDGLGELLERLSQCTQQIGKMMTSLFFQREREVIA